MEKIIFLLFMAKKSNLVVLSNRLVEARYRLSLVEQQLILFSIVQARENQKGLFPLAPVTISAIEFGKMFNISTDNVYRQLKEALERLFNRSLSYQEFDDELGDVWEHKTHWLSRASYMDGKGNIQLIFAPDVVPLLVRLEREFTRYRIELIGNLDSIYSVRLYQLLVQNLTIGKREFEIGWLRETFELENKYTQVKDFKKWVIDVAVKQINAHMDIKVGYKQRKTGRSVTHLDFTIRSSAKKPSRIVVNKDYVERHARVGESYDAAYRRLAEEAGQKRLLDD